MRPAAGRVQAFAGGYGGAEQMYQLKGAIGAWAEVVLPGNAVTNCGVQVGVYTQGSEGQWLMIDDVSLVRQ